MNLGSLITVTGLFIAVYAIIPRVRRLEISLGFGLFGWITVLISFISIIYLQFYQTFQILGLTPGLNLARWSITTSNASFIILLFMSLTIYVYLRLESLKRSNIIKFREFVFELSREKRYSELFSLIDRHLKQIVRLSNAKFIGARIHNYFETKITELSDEQNKQNTDSFRWIANKLKKTIYILLAAVLPTYVDEKTAVKEIINEVLINKNTVNAMVTIRPYFALKILGQNLYENNEFVDTYLRYLAEDTKSVLYHEIRNNQNISCNNKYDLPKRNRLLNFLFADCRKAKRYAVYNPMGKFIINELDRLKSQHTPDLYNEPMGIDFEKYGQWESKLFIGIRFFDIMVTSALHQNIKWHMWFYYFPRFVERIVRNLDPNEKLIDPYSEWPTKYHYALYEITSCLCKWVSAVEHVSLNQENVFLKDTSADHENYNIPKSSMLALGQVIKHILTSDALTDNFKKYIFDIVYDQYRELSETEKTSRYAEALINAIIYGGSRMTGISIEYKQILLSTFEKIQNETEISAELKEILTNSLDI